MTSQKLLTFPAIVAGLLLIGTLVAGTIVLLRGGDEAPDEQGISGYAPVIHMERFPPLGAWDTVPGAVSGLRMSVEGEPVLVLDAQTSVAITPSLRGFTPIRWGVAQEGPATQFIGKAVGEEKLLGAELYARWTFVQGNPQVSLVIHLVKLPAWALAQDVALEISLPPGHSSSSTMPGTLPARRVTWRAGGAATAPALSFEQWSGSALEFATDGASEPATTLRLKLWDHAAHPAAVACVGASDVSSVSMSGELMMTVGEPPEVMVWPYQRGSVAALAPVFDLPAHHPDPLLAEAAAPDARRWALRARALIYGYSDTDDPRYANGGLLGNDLGATIVVPPAFLQDSAVQALASSLKGTLVELAAPHAEGAMPSVFAANSHVASELRCAEFIAPQLLSVPAVIVTDYEAEKTPSHVLRTTPGTVQTAVIPEFFDGRLHTLVTSGFGVESQEALLNAHATRVFAAPFVATRNPLIGAAHQSLLVPESDGHWSLSDSLSSALVNLSLWRETAPLLVSSVEALARHAYAGQAVRWWWDATGRLQVHNPRQVPVEGFTLAIPGELSARVASDADASPTRIRRRTWPAKSQAGDAQPLTLLWWDLAPGTVSLALERDGRPLTHELATRTWALE